jgi:hypothetical protein
MSSLTNEAKLVTKFLGRRRVFTIISVWLLVLLEVAMMEGDELLHAFDDYSVVAIAAITIILVFMWRHKTSLAELKKQTNIITALFVVGLAVKLFAVIVEASDAADFGDEIPLFVLMIIMVVNRFV